jgi:hypothetical protein
METSEQLPEGVVEAPDLAEVIGRDGPFLTIHLTTRSDIENAAERVEQRWRTLRGDLGDRGVPEEALAHLDPAIEEAHLRSDGLVAVATVDGIAHVEHGPVPPGPLDEGWWEPAPRLRKVIEWRQEAPPYVVVLADRRGADLYAFLHGPEEHADVEREVDTDLFPLRKVGPGGWSQRRFQDRAENNWEENAENVTEAAAHLARRVHARLIVLAGDVRTVAMIKDDFPKELAGRIESVSGERPWEGSGGTIPDEVGDLVRSLTERETNALLERFREERGQGDLASEGVGRTVAALSSGQVAVLLFQDDPTDDRTLWIGRDPARLATSEQRLSEFRVAAIGTVPAGEAMIRAALATSAGIRIVHAGAGLADGVGALLRWST